MGCFSVQPGVCGVFWCLWAVFPPGSAVTGPGCAQCVPAPPVPSPPAQQGQQGRAGTAGTARAGTLHPQLMIIPHKPSPFISPDSRGWFPWSCSIHTFRKHLFYFFSSPIDTIWGFYGNISGGKGKGCDVSSRAGVIPGTPSVRLGVLLTHFMALSLPLVLILEFWTLSNMVKKKKNNNKKSWWVPGLIKFKLWKSQLKKGEKMEFQDLSLAVP